MTLTQTLQVGRWTIEFFDNGTAFAKNKQCPQECLAGPAQWVMKFLGDLDRSRPDS